MIRFNFKVLVLIASLFSVFSFSNAFADKETSSTTTTTTQTPEGATVVKEVTKTTRVVTPTPAAKEIIAAPSGYASCYTVPEGWSNDIWVPSHQVCKYENNAEGVAWISGYWGCNKVTGEGVCSNWEWKAGHWEKTLVTN